MNTTFWRLAATVVAASAIAGCGGGNGASFTPPVTAPASAVQQTAVNPATSSELMATPAALRYISKATAERIALAAVHGGVVMLAVLETNDQPVHWSIDIRNRRGDYEVWVDARTGKVLKIIAGG